MELADQYKVMDAVSDVRRRNTLAQHLREVVDILEQKVCSFFLGLMTAYNKYDIFVFPGRPDRIALRFANLSRQTRL